MSSLPVETAFLLPFDINPVLPEEHITAFLEIVALQDTVHSAQDPPSLPLFTFRPITRLKFQQVLKNEEQNVTHEERYYTSREVHNFSNLHR